MAQTASGACASVSFARWLAQPEEDGLLTEPPIHVRAGVEAPAISR